MLGHLARWWVLVAVLAAAAAGEWLVRPEWSWVAVVWVLAPLAVLARRPWRGWTYAFAGATLLLLVGLALAQSRLSRIESAWPAERESRVSAAGRTLGGDLHDAFRRIDQLAGRAMPLADGTDQADALESLERIVPEAGPETGVAVLGADGTPWAWAGVHRIPTAVEGDSIAARATGYYLVLETRRHTPSGRTVVASVVVWAHPVAVTRSRSVAELFERRTGVELAVYPAGQAPDSADVFDYQEETTAGPRLLFSVQPIPPEQGAARQRALGAARQVLTVLLLAWLAVALFGTRTQSRRFVLLLTLLWLAVRAPVGEALHLGSVFSPATYFHEALGPLSASAGALVLTGALGTVLGVWLWRRRLPRRWYTAAPALVLLAATPHLVSALGRGITPPARGVPAGLWLTWEAALLMAAAAPITLAAALLRGRGGATEPRWRVPAGVVIALAAAAVGLFVWQPDGGWPVWYPFLWVPALLLVAVPAPRWWAIAGVALAAGSLATLVTWGMELPGRLAVAGRDVARLGREPDPFALALLERFADRVRERGAAGDTVAGASELYTLWRTSDLGQQGYPAHLALWTADGALRAELPLDSLDLPALPPLVRALDTAGRRITALERVPGVHYLLVQRVAPGRLVSVAVGPRTELIEHGRLGQLLDPARRAPLYRLNLSQPGAQPGTRRAGAGAELAWRREGWQLRADHALDFPDGAREAHAVVELGGPFPLAVRGALVVLFDLAVLGLLWRLAELSAGGRARPPRWRALLSSFRIRLAVTLAGFFILPVVGFAVWGFARLSDEADRSRDLLILQTLRDASSAAGGILRSPDVRLAPELQDLSRRMDADLGLYAGGRLEAVSAEILADLGVLSPLMDPTAYHLLAIDGEQQVTRDGTNPELAERIGFRLVEPGRPGVPAVLAAPQRTDPFRLEDTQLDLALVLLLATLTGAAAALLGARIAARTLSRPVAELRRAALALGQGRSMPSPAHAPPLEFEPVFGAFERMAADIAASQAALEEARRRTATVLATVATGVVALDARGRVLIANAQAAELLGVPLEPGAALLPRLEPEWQPLADALRREQLAEGIDGDGNGAPEEAVEVSVGGRRYTAQLAVLGGGLRGVVVALNDVTDVSRAERVLAWGEMARQVAHEIKNPLTPMRLGMQHLVRVHRDRRPEFDRILAETAERILGEIDRLDTIARAFSRFAAPVAEQLPLERVDLAGTAAEVVNLYRLAGEGASVELDAVPSETAARRDEVKEVLVNLLENARNAGARRIVVRIRPEELVVEDDGSGIPAESLPRIFEPRFSTNTSGSGLGLAIVRRLVESWGARVSAESEVGRGTTVRVQLAR